MKKYAAMETEILTIENKTGDVFMDHTFSAQVSPIQKCIAQLNEKINELQKENVRLKRMYDDLSLDHRVLKKIILKRIS